MVPKKTLANNGRFQLPTFPSTAESSPDFWLPPTSHVVPKPTVFVPGLGSKHHQVLEGLPEANSDPLQQQCEVWKISKKDETTIIWQIAWYDIIFDILVMLAMVFSNASMLYIAVSNWSHDFSESNCNSKHFKNETYQNGCVWTRRIIFKIVTHRFFWQIL